MPYFKLPQWVNRPLATRWRGVAAVVLVAFLIVTKGAIFPNRGFAQDDKGIVLRFVTVHSEPIDGIPISLTTGGSTNTYATPFTRGTSRLATLTAPATHNGYEFVEWREGTTVISTDPSVDVTIGSNENLMLTVVYQPITYSLHVESSPENGVYIGVDDTTGPQLLTTTPYVVETDFEEVLRLSAQKLWNCRPFARWLRNGVEYSTEDVTIITMNDDIVMTAEYGPESSPEPGLFPEPVALNMNALTDTRTDLTPVVATDGLGHWVAVWTSAETVGNSQDADIFVSRSTNNGATWTPQIALNTNAATDTGVDSSPVIATDGLGNWVAAWYSNDTLGGTIGTDNDILVSRSTDNGASWTPPAPLNANAGGDTGGDFNPGVVTDGVGNWIAAWSSDDSLGGTIGTDYDILIARSTDNGANWTVPEPLNSNADSDSGADAGVHVAKNGSDGWVSVWRSNETLGNTVGTDLDIFFSRSSDAGATWTPPEPLNTNAATDSGSDEAPKVACDGAGNLTTVWRTRDTLGGTIGQDSDILLARSSDGGATWSDPQPLNTDAETDSAADTNPLVVTDGLGHWVAAWQRPSILVEGHFSVVDLLYARSTDSGVTWTDPGSLYTGANTSYSGFSPFLCTDGMGHWVAAWGTHRAFCADGGTDSDVLVAAMDRATDTDGDGLDDMSETDTGVYVDGWDTGTDPNQPDTIRVTKPNGGETWTRGEKERIRWNSEGAVGDTVRIELWRNGAFARVIKGATPNDGKQNWRVPNNVKPRMGYEIVIQSIDVPAIQDSSDTAFRVVNGNSR